MKRVEGADVTEDDKGVTVQEDSDSDFDAGDQFGGKNAKRQRKANK